MIESMTGFGSAESGIFRVEARSVNHRFMEIMVKMPDYLHEHEMALRNALKERFSRGKFDIIISTIDDGRIRIKVNTDVIKALYNSLNALKEDLSLSGEIGIGAIAQFRDIFLSSEAEYDASSLYNAFNEAIGGLRGMRLKEGEAIVKDMLDRLELVHQMNEQVALLCPEAKEACRQKLMERLKALLAEAQFDETRLLHEIAILTERTDFNEETIRIGSHIAQMRKILTEGDIIGRKAEFILQELNREVNTIASKAIDYRISRVTIEMKSEIEKLREQAQNIQ